MRPINNKQIRITVNLDALNAANDAIGSPQSMTWEQFLRRYEDDATALRTGLWKAGNYKCWFSEAELQFGEGQIEHYRPKGRLSGTRHGGYKWRTFDWRNLRFAHPTVNLRRKDFLTKRNMGKGSYFPLRAGSPRAVIAPDEVNEEPVLLDPTIPYDASLIVFDEPSGTPRPRFRKDENEWLHQRAAESIEFYHLNEGRWNANRQDRMAAVKALCEQLENLSELGDEDAYQKKIGEIFEYVHESAEFSSACCQVLRERGVEYVIP